MHDELNTEDFSLQQNGTQKTDFSRKNEHFFPTNCSKIKNKNCFHNSFLIIYETKFSIELNSPEIIIENNDF